MLLTDLRKAIEDMEEIRSLEQDSQDSQNQNRIDHLYATEIENNNKIVYYIENARNIVKFTPSLSLKEQLLKLMKDSRDCTEMGLVSESCLRGLQNSTKKVRKDFETEWNTFYKGISEKRLHMLVAIKEITPDRMKTGYAINKIRNGCAVNDESDKKMRQLAEGLSEADDILRGLGLDKEKEIMDFLNKVAEGRASVSDLTDSVEKWIGEKNLGSKFLIQFGS